MASLTQAQHELRRASSNVSKQGSREYAPVALGLPQEESTNNNASSPSKAPRHGNDFSGCLHIVWDNKFLSCLLINIPIGYWAHVTNWDAQWRFTFNFLAIIPLAWLIGKSTEDLSAVTNSTVGGLINATFGNIVEMLLCIAGIRQNEIIVTQCTLIGSILSNLLLVLGTAFFVGGVFYKTQTFSQQGAQTQCSLMALSVFSIGLPTIYVNILQQESEWDHMVTVSRWASILLLFIYAAYLVFQLKTHAHLFEDEGGEEEEEQPDLSPVGSLILLMIATLVTKVATDALIASIEGTVDSFELSKEFIGIILLPIIGNAAEHYTAITVAARNKMDLSLGVAAGSSCQMALLVTPFTILVGWFYDKDMSLDFHLFQLAVLLLSVFLIISILADGSSNWLEGLMLVTTYLIIALMYYFEGTGPNASLATMA